MNRMTFLSTILNQKNISSNLIIGTNMWRFENG